MDLVEQIASALHDAWRAPRRLPDDTFEPRWKDDGAGGSVDIANTDYAALPEPWQRENRAAAQDVVAALGQTTVLEDAADLVHRDWLARNAAWAPAEQLLPYPQLTESEKDKDRAVATVAARIMGITLT